LFSEEWTEALDVPVLNPGKDASRVASYRSISLTSYVCKLFEKIVNNRLVKDLSLSNSMVSEETDPRQMST
jgi:hypothetical protein